MKRRDCCNDNTVTTSNDISLSLTLFLSPNVRSIPYIPHFLFVFIGTFPLCLSFPPLLPALYLRKPEFLTHGRTQAPLSPLMHSPRFLSSVRRRALKIQRGLVPPPANRQYTRVPRGWRKWTKWKWLVRLHLPFWRCAVRCFVVCGVAVRWKGY